MDQLGWFEKFAQCIISHSQFAAGLTYEYVKMERHDWLENCLAADAVLWKPEYMGPQSAHYFKEKIYLLQCVAHKLVMPNFQTIWHFESKVAQHHLLSFHNLPRPATFVTFDHAEARKRLQESAFPFVYKASAGASSQNVRLIAKQRHGKRLLDDLFAIPRWEEAKRRVKNTKLLFLQNITNRWTWSRTWQRLWRNPENVAVFYHQEFLTENRRDLRITVIGDHVAYAFWRKNRKNDFRASGSGLIDYESPVPSEIIKYCMSLNKMLQFDSMAYDLILKDERYVITEISYGYKDHALYNAPGYYQLNPNGELSFTHQHTWPQQFWVDWLLKKLLQEPLSSGATELP